MNANPNSSWMQQPPLAAEAEGYDPTETAETQHTPTYHSTVAEAGGSAAEAPPLHTIASPPASAQGFQVRISEAMRLSDDAARDAALIVALRGISSELEAAEEERARSEKRVEFARELFDWATGALSGYSKTKEPKGEDAVKLGRKRKGETVNEVDYEEKFMPPNEGQLIPPLIATSGGGMTEEQVVAHRDAFYRKLCNVPYAELSSYTPPAHVHNLRTKAQLEECVYIVTHWNTGADGLEMMDFRRKHKTFYTKIKMSKENIGRRTGHHLRDLAGNDGRKAFCRFGRSDESLMYVSVEELYDAIFEIHCLTGHRGWQATKKIANLKYANVPQDQIKCFVETCPICCSKKAGPRPQKYKMKEEQGEQALV